MGTDRIHGRTITAVMLLLLSCLIAGAPAAHAFFTSAATAKLTAGTHILAAPADNIITATCLPLGNSGKHRLDIIVVSHGTVPKANAYALTITDPSNNKVTRDLTTTVRGYSSNSAASGTWEYAVEAQYQVPDTTNAWSSSSQPLRISC
ncbi:hypothetical protein ACFVYC_09220 [Pseudarthrobacter sp. NPDC058329]|uniref:hypothetical protein n=1 Tax=Pseudarthrobacter sp. NPDC058329 TaxID=3346448 RepID=UPI0036DB84C2